MYAQLSKAIRTILYGLGTPKNGDCRRFVTFQLALKHQKTVFYAFSAGNPVYGSYCEKTKARLPENSSVFY
jgi:hypothetical protein